MPPSRQRFPWKIRDTEIPLGARTCIMGILDLSEQTFPGRPDVDDCLRQALEMEEQGASLIDLAVVPQQPLPRRLDADFELRRIVPVLRKLRPRATVPLSVCTYNAETAARALELGVAVINDPSGLAVDPALAKVVNDAGAGLVLVHSSGPPETWMKPRLGPHIADRVLTELESAVARARGAGVDRRSIVVDPGLDIGKRGLQNYELLDQLEVLTALGHPVMVSPSGKAFLTDSMRAPESEWLMSAGVVAGFAVRGGAHLLRAAHLDSIRVAARTADRIFDAAEAPRSARVR